MIIPFPLREIGGILRSTTRSFMSYFTRNTTGMFFSGAPFVPPPASSAAAGPSMPAVPSYQQEPVEPGWNDPPLLSAKKKVSNRRNTVRIIAMFWKKGTKHYVSKIIKVMSDHNLHVLQFKQMFMCLNMLPCESDFRSLLNMNSLHLSHNLYLVCPNHRNRPRQVHQTMREPRCTTHRTINSNNNRCSNSSSK